MVNSVHAPIRDSVQLQTLTLSTHHSHVRISMKTMILAAAAMFLALTMAQHAHSADTPIATPIAGIDDAALARSARASKLVGNKVYKGDTSIGQIEDVLIDLDHATAVALILSVGGFLGMGDKLVAVPVTQVKVDSEARFTTDLTKDQLANAPAFDFAKLK
jgi:sporulation protein YlmC with PRC-barrel domain